jgi:hypothetical protein
MMKSVLDDLWLNHDRKCGKSGRGYPGRPTTNDSRCLQHCPTAVRNVPGNFVRWAQHAMHCNKICAKADNTPAHASLVVQHPSSSLLTGPRPLWFFPSPQDEIVAQEATFLAALKISRPYRSTWWRRWREMTSRIASDHGNPAGIAVSMPKGTTSKRMGANRNFVTWLSYGRVILGTLG